MRQITQPLVVAALLLLTTCSPMEPIYKQLDSVDHPIQESIVYTLTDTGYKTIAITFAKDEVTDCTGSSKGEFAEEVQRETNYIKTSRTLTAWVSPDRHVPTLIAKMYPEWGGDFTVTVSYAMQQDATSSKLISVKASVDDATKAGLAAKDPNELSKDEITKLDKYLATTYANKGASYLAKIALAEGKHNMLFTGERLTNNHTYRVTSPAEHQTMGSAHDNFSNSMLSERYILQLLQQSMPHARPGNQLIMVYEWFEDRLTTPGYQSFELRGNQWCMAQAADQFVNLGKQWVFDPTIHFMLTADSFMALYAWVKANKPDYISKKHSNDSEWWFCGNARYENFTLTDGMSVGPRPDEEGKSAGKLIKLRLERIKEGLKLILEAHYADKPAQANGTDQMYIITTVLRQTSNSTVTLTYKGPGGGNFEHVSRPNAIQFSTLT